MVKRDKIADPTSCLNRAADDEPVFVLLARDESAVSTVLAWISHRIEDGLNERDDSQILEAYKWCNAALEWRAKQ